MMELLSPAGGMEQLRAAARFGADAVYGGLKKFGLRAAAGNFDWDELQTALDLLHGQGKKFYLTLNILPYDDELAELGQSARRRWAWTRPSLAIWARLPIFAARCPSLRYM